MNIDSESAVTFVTHERRVRACSGPCDQGRKPCPCPLDCWLEADELTTPSTAEAWAVWLAVVITVAGCLAAVFYPR